MFKSFAEFFDKELTNESNRITEDIITGSCQNHNDYRYMVGVLQGIAVAKRVFDDLQHKLENDEDGRRNKGKPQRGR